MPLELDGIRCNLAGTLICNCHKKNQNYYIWTSTPICPAVGKGNFGCHHHLHDHYYYHHQWISGSRPKWPLYFRSIYLVYTRIATKTNTMRRCERDACFPPCWHAHNACPLVKCWIRLNRRVDLGLFAISQKNRFAQGCDRKKTHVESVIAESVWTMNLWKKLGTLLSVACMTD